MAETIQNITINIPYTAQDNVPINVAYAVVDKNNNVVNYSTMLNSMNVYDIDKYISPQFYISYCNLNDWNTTKSLSIPDIGYYGDDTNVLNFETSPIKYQLTINAGQNPYNSSLYYIYKANAENVESPNYLQIIQAKNPSGLDMPSGSKISL